MRGLKTGIRKSALFLSKLQSGTTPLKILRCKPTRNQVKLLYYFIPFLFSSMFLPPTLMDGSLKQWTVDCEYGKRICVAVHRLGCQKQFMHVVELSQHPSRYRANGIIPHPLRTSLCAVSLLLSQYNYFLWY